MAARLRCWWDRRPPVGAERDGEGVRTCGFGTDASLADVALLDVVHCRTRVPLDELAAGQVQDAWLDISIPSQGSTPAKEKRGARDKLAGALFGAKGSSPKDVAGCQVHVKVRALPVVHACMLH